MAMKKGFWLAPDERAFLKSQRLKQGFNEETVVREMVKTTKTINRQGFAHEERKVVEQQEKEKNVNQNFKQAFTELISQKDSRPKRFENNYFRNEGELI